jgi:hypothetical protein
MKVPKGSAVENEGKTVIDAKSDCWREKRKIFPSDPARAAFSFTSLWTLEDETMRRQTII